MSLADHIATFLMGSLDQPKAGTAKPDRPEFWGQFAFPPTAEADLLAICTASAPNGSLSGLQLAPKKHSSLAPDKQFAGIPLDWYIVRIGTGPDYPPDLYLLDGSKIAALPINGGKIRADFFSGQNVRVNAHGFSYPSIKGGLPGVSFSLDGVMAVGGGERRTGGDGGEPSESAFAKYRSDAPAESSGNSATVTHPTASTGSNGNPFAQSGNTAAANPFG